MLLFGREWWKSSVVSSSMRVKTKSGKPYRIELPSRVLPKCYKPISPDDWKWSSIASFSILVVFQVANASNLSVLVAANINHFLDWILTSHNRPHSSCPIEHWKTFPAKASRSSSLFEWSASIIYDFLLLGFLKEIHFPSSVTKLFKNVFLLYLLCKISRVLFFGSRSRVEEIKELLDGPNSNWH